MTKLHSDLGEFGKAMNPDVQVLYGRDPRHAVECQAPMLCVIDAAYGVNAAAVWLAPHLRDLCIYCGVRDKLNEQQLEKVAEIIRYEFGYLKASEMMLFFWRFKAGCYGRFYGIVDPLIIMDALRNGFVPERNRMLEKIEKEQRDAEYQAWLDSDRITLEEYYRRKNNGQ